MPRGTCEKCGEFDVFVHPTPLSCQAKAFLCVRCINLFWNNDVLDEDSDALSKSPAEVIQRGIKFSSG